MRRRCSGPVRYGKSLVAATPEAARAVAEVLRRHLAAPEQRSYPGADGATRLHLTVDTGSPAGPAGPDGSWLATSRPTAGTGTHADETAVPGAHRC
ncbi:hypothetical protein [Streptomyces erythrochromogenes]|uniref:hypothetical protein n=1 Tax=Streptomyces erythrochromogenes TaxID=285574 RepID=UPI003870544B|nr:hypothetical protein OG489_20975 [Streptomyces erythrochromogenes]